MKVVKGRFFGVLIVSVLVLGAGIVTVARFSVTSDLSPFFPSDESSDEIQLSRALLGSSLSRTMVLTVEGERLEDAVEAGRQLETFLASDSSIALESVHGGPDAGIEQAIYEAYFPRRYSFFAPDVASAKEALGDSALDAAVRRLRKRLSEPMSPLLSRVVRDDPWLILPDLYERFHASHDVGLSLHEGRFVTSDRRFSVLFVSTRASAFDAPAQSRLLHAISHHFRRVQERMGGTLSLEQSGVNRFAVSAASAIESDIKRVSIGSSLCLVLMMTVLFRSVRLIGLALIPIGSGMLVASAVSLLLFGRLHGITLAFGASLIGVAIDYVVHFYCHHAVSPHPEGPGRTFDVIWPSLRTGAVTTLGGFVLLGASRLQGLREVALFATVGIAVALAVTRAVLPVFVPREVRAPAIRESVSRFLSRGFFVLSSRPSVLYALVGVAVLAVAFGLPRVRFSQGFATPESLDSRLVDEDERVRARVSHFEQRRFVVALGENEQEALEVNEQVERRLRAAKASGDLLDFRTVSTFLPSAKTQQEVARVVRERPGLLRSMKEKLLEYGFRAELFGGLEQAVRAHASMPPLTYGDLASTPLAPVLRPHRLNLPDRTGFVTFLLDVSNPVALRTRIESIAGAFFVEQGTLTQRAIRAYLKDTSLLLVVGLFFVFALLWLRYRRTRVAFAGFLPALVAALVTVSMLGLFGREVDIVILTGLLIVVSMGVDYSVFLIDSHRNGKHEEASVMSVALAGVSTLVGFGLLAFSRHPVLASLGMAAAVGILCCLVLAPTAIVLLRERDEATSDSKSA